MDRYEIFSSVSQASQASPDKDLGAVKQWYWRLVGKNNKIVAQSEGYNRRSQAIAAVDRVRVIAQTTAVVENLGRGDG